MYMTTIEVIVASLINKHYYNTIELHYKMFILYNDYYYSNTSSLFYIIIRLYK